MTKNNLTIEEKILWLRVIYSKGVGPLTFWKLMNKYDNSIENVFKSLKEKCPGNTAENELLEHEKKNFKMIFACEDSFPQELLNLKDCPPVISVAGNISLLNRASLAIVGARNASILGQMLAKKMAKTFSENSFVTVSGMARGIDSAAHEGSIQNGTIAVLAGGADIIYPPENTSLYKSIIEHGAIISEMPLGTPIEASLFPRRNRIIAGLSKGTVIIEAALQSGSLITANYALEQGKDVFAVPSFPTDPRSRGCNLLIKQGAVLVESAEDVLEEIYIDNVIRENIENELSLNENSFEVEFCEEDNLKKEILSSLSPFPTSIEILFQNQNCSLPSLLSILNDLELEGKILRHPNSDISLR